MKPLLLFIIPFLWVFSPVQLFSQERTTDPDQARTVFKEMEDRRSSISTETAQVQMVITDSRNRTRERTFQSWSQYEDGDSKTLIIFEQPGNIRGTGFLNTDENGIRTQRLFLPSVGRIQTISSSERGDRFMGSDFTYEDLDTQYADDYDFEWLETGTTLYTIRASKMESDQYAYLEFDIDRNTYTATEIRYFDSNETMIKQLISEDFEQVSDLLWSPAKMTMFDLLEKRHTELLWIQREINVPVESWKFTERGLRRGI